MYKMSHMKYLEEGVDVLSFGATKNGCLAAEAIIFFKKELVGILLF